jgi:hypothetical protein
MAIEERDPRGQSCKQRLRGIEALQVLFFWLCLFPGKAVQTETDGLIVSNAVIPFPEAVAIPCRRQLLSKAPGFGSGRRLTREVRV